MKYHVVIDTNVLVSALLSKRSESATVIVMEKVFAGEIIPVFCKEILEEYSSVLLRKKFGFDVVTVHLFLHEFNRRGIIVDMEQADIILPDMKDKPFYAVALACENDEGYLITGNLKHFPTRPFIVSPARFLEILQNAD